MNFSVDFKNGAFVEILSDTFDTYTVEFIDSDNDVVVYSTELSNMMWAKCNREYYVNWKIRFTKISNNETFDYKFDIQHNSVLIDICDNVVNNVNDYLVSILNFKMKHECKVYVHSNFNHIFKYKYHELIFVDDLVDLVNLNIYASYKLGKFLNENGDVDYNIHPSSIFLKSPMEISNDILGVCI